MTKLRTNIGKNHILKQLVHKHMNFKVYHQKLRKRVRVWVEKNLQCTKKTVVMLSEAHESMFVNGFASYQIGSWSRLIFLSW